MQYLRGQFEQYAQVLQSLSNRVEDLTDTVTAAPLEQTAVKQTETDSTNSLVDQMRVLIDTVSKKRKTRKTKLSTLFEQSSASETETENVPQRHLIRPMKFDGVGSFETFMAHFRNCATHNRWNQTEQLSWLKNSLIKNAGQVLLDSSPESTDTLPTLIELLTNRFGGTKQTDKHRMELRYRKRRPNESLSELHQDISRLMALAHPQLPSTSRDAIACDYYIDSLNDPDFALKVRERNPSSLDDVCVFHCNLKHGYVILTVKKGKKQVKVKCVKAELLQSKQAIRLNLLLLSHRLTHLVSSSVR